jgi:hypothetical protein
MALSKEEFTKLLQKIRDLYDEYAKKYSPKWFDRNSFEERYRMSLSHRMDIEAFLLAEIANFEKIRERYEKKKKEKESFSFKIDKIIEENNARIVKYEMIDFHQRASLEIKHMYGAIAGLAQNYFPVLWLIFTDYQRRNSISKLEHSFQRCALPRGTKPPEAIEDHILLLNREGITDIEIEKGKNVYLKECAFLLFELIEFCDSFFTERQSDLDLPVTFEKAFFSPDIKRSIVDNFSECTGYGALLKIKQYAEEILTDFRLNAFNPAR